MEHRYSSRLLFLKKKLINQNRAVVTSETVGACVNDLPGVATWQCDVQESQWPGAEPTTC